MSLSISEISYEELLCHAFRHRWIPRAARPGVAGGARVWDWELECETGCGSKATEWRDDYGNRLPGTQRRYTYPQSYKAGNGYTQGEYIVEVSNRLRPKKRNGRRRAS